DAGIFRSDPVLAADSSGRIFYYSLSTNSTFSEFFCDMFISQDGGLTWGNPIPARGGDKQWITIDKTGGKGDGYIYAMWNPNFTCCPSGYFTRSVDNGQNYLLPIDSPAPIIWGTLDVGPDGELYICGASTTASFGVIRSDDAQLAGILPTFPQAVAVDLGILRFREGPNPGGLLGQFDVATDHSNSPSRGTVYFLGSVQMDDNDPMDIGFSRSTDGGLTWSPATRINTDPQLPGKYNWFGTMSVAPCGRIDVIWNDMRNDTDGTMSALYYSFSNDQGESWSPNTQVSPEFNSLIGHPNQDKIGDYYDMRSTDDAVHIAYSATFNGEQDVYYLRIPSTSGVLLGDVNRDGVVDLLDVAPFVDAINTNTYVCEADLNQDGFVNLFDIEPLIQLLTGA
ncbi:MAG: dockerin type I domain-containing protein, partial [Planctomycetota bacterium]